MLLDIHLVNERMNEGINEMSGQEQVLHTTVDSLGIAFFMDIKLVTTHRQSGKKSPEKIKQY